MQISAQNLEKLRAAILVRHKTVYAFWKANEHKISKSVVVQVLLGNYPGNCERQISKIWNVLNNQENEFKLSQSNIIDSLKEVACRHCNKKRKRKNCRVCNSIWRQQAMKILKLAENAD